MMVILLADCTPKWIEPISPVITPTSPSPVSDLEKLIAALQNEDPNIRLEAADALGGLGAKAEAATPSLIAASGDPDVRVRVVVTYALGRIGAHLDKTVPALALLLKDPHEDVRYSAAKSLGRIGSEAQNVTAALGEALSDTDENVRHASAEALVRVDPTGANPSVLVAALKDPNWYVRENATLALTTLGASAVPTLIQKLKEQDWQISGNIIAILSEIGTDAVPALVAMVKDQVVTLPSRGLAIITLIKIMGTTKTVSLLLQLIGEGNAVVRQRIIAALKVMGPEAVPGLIAAYQATGEQQMRRQIIDVLAEIGPRAYAGFVVALQDENADVRAYAEIKATQIYTKSSPVLGVQTFVNTAAGKGFAVKEVVPLLIAALQDSQPDIRHEALEALQMIGPEAIEAAPQILIALSDQEPTVRCEAALALLLIEPPAIAVAPALAIALHDENANIVCLLTKEDRALLRILSRQNPQAQTLAALITYSAQHGDGVKLRRIVAVILSLLGTEARCAIPELIHALGDQDLRYSAAEALGRIGDDAVPDLLMLLKGSNVEVAPELAEALQGKDLDVRRSAAYALLQTGVAQAIADELLIIMQDQDEDLAIRSMVAAALKKSGQDVQAFWILQGITNPLKSSCLVGSNFGVAGGLTFDIYNDVCNYESPDPSPNWQAIFEGLVNFLTGK